ncbi:hypothetical protein CEF21_21485 [Bacillus sp. FJAT-42376]|uniref:hypothetical protein n=1 Tax=Bacillus sp. FJAT-42376 TaxID=2014076 RepID=UPI000F5058A9|nr:hypothetical protein [Bacillus sp. FJAT-42376]AZB44654.1 hypothetical protein CEF21_21485 [Bacillus sp. FJAT-42376]
MQHLLSEFQQHRLDWAFEAKNDFLSRFQVFQAMENAKSSKKLIISVYGPTQVGKTTLILTLLGVKEEYLEEISDFLRGKRKLGESATATVTKYQISPTDEYMIKMPNKKEKIIKTTQQLEDQMAHVRYLVESGSIQNVDPVVIAIPKSKFDEQVVSIELIDLPGIESAEKNEIKHVERCVKFWIPNSHICLIVNGAADLTFLRDIQMPQLLKWYEHPENYFVILTRAFSPESVNKRIKNKEFESSYDVVAYYQREIEAILKINQPTIYPVEIGGSFKNLTEQERLFASDILYSFKNLIYNVDVQKISFGFLTGYYKEILKQSEQEIRHLENQIALEKVESKRIEKNFKTIIDKQTDELIAVTERIEVLNESLVKADEIYVKKIKSDYFKNRVQKLFEKASIERKASKLNELTSNTILVIQDSMRLHLDEINGFLEKINHNLELPSYKSLRIDANIEINFLYWDYSKIDLYFFQKHFYAKKEEILLRLLEEINTACSNISGAYQKLRIRCSLLEEELRESKKSLENQLNVKVQEKKILLQHKNEQIQKLDKELQLDVKYWNKDLEHAAKYKHFFIQHFIRRKDALLEMAASASLQDQYLANLFLYTLGTDAANIIDSMEFNYDD